MHKCARTDKNWHLVVLQLYNSCMLVFEYILGSHGHMCDNISYFKKVVNLEPQETIVV